MRERIAESLEWLAAHPRSTVLDIKKLKGRCPCFDCEWATIGLSTS